MAGMCTVVLLPALKYTTNAAATTTTITTTTTTTKCSRVLEKLTGPELVKKFPAFYGTRKYITAFTSSRHLFLASARSIQSMPPIPLPKDQF
jgi:hypothetical protein